MKLFHGSFEKTAPKIKIGEFALGTSDNVFDGLFASDNDHIAESHGHNVFAYEVDENRIADSSVMNEKIEAVIEFLRGELYECDDDDVLSDIANAIADDDCGDDFEEYISPRSCTGDCTWEMQRLRGRAAAALGFDAVEMHDEHGTSYLIVNPKIVAE